VGDEFAGASGDRREIARLLDVAARFERGLRGTACTDMAPVPKLRVQVAGAGTSVNTRHGPWWPSKQPRSPSRGLGTARREPRAPAAGQVLLSGSTIIDQNCPRRRAAGPPAPPKARSPGPELPTGTKDAASTARAPKPTGRAPQRPDSTQAGNLRSSPRGATQPWTRLLILAAGTSGPSPCDREDRDRSDRSLMMVSQGHHDRDYHHGLGALQYRHRDPTCKPLAAKASKMTATIVHWCHPHRKSCNAVGSVCTLHCMQGIRNRFTRKTVADDMPPLGIAELRDRPPDQPAA
jgi:hypothetical protein